MLVVSLVIVVVVTVILAIVAIATWVAIGPGLLLLKVMLAVLIIVGVNQTLYFIARLVTQHKKLRKNK